MQDLKFDRTMTNTEALMWRLEKDPHLSSQFASIMLLDSKPDFDAFRRRMELATYRVPRLRQRVQPSPANLSPPVWVDDPDFDIDMHVRKIACPKPGTLREVLDLATLLLADPLDRTRPLWQFIVVEGMRGDKAAIIQKMHHTLSDGVRGVELSLAYLDFERDAPQPSLQDIHDAAPAEDDAYTDETSAPPSDFTRSADAMMGFVAGSMRLPFGVARQVADLLADPAGIGEASSSAARTLKAVVTTLSDTSPARSPLWTKRSLRRHIETARAPFRSTKDNAKKLGGTLNTAFLAAAAHAAANYHIEMGAPVDTLRASMAVSVRTEDTGAANAFSLVKLNIPAAEMSIRDRFAAIVAATDAARGASKSPGLDTIAALTAALPTAALTRFARSQAQTIDFATSNVKGSPVPIFVCGAQVTAIYPVGPLGGVAFNLTLMSYLGSLDMALNVDTAAVERPDLLSHLLIDAFNEFENV